MKIAPRIAEFVSNNKPIRKTLEFVDKNPSLFETSFVLGISTIARPLTIMATPSDKDNKRYYISRSIISGILDFGISFSFFYPLGKWIKKQEEELIKKAGTIYHNSPKTVDAIKTLVNRGSKFLILPIQAWCLFYLIPKTVDKWFPIVKKKINEVEINTELLKTFPEWNNKMPPSNKEIK